VAEYRLDELGWFQFERLCQSLLKARCGLSVEAWGGNGDLGRDAYSAGPLCFPGENENDGPFVFQAKFVSGANGAGAEPMKGLLKGVRAELARITEREEDGKWEEPAFYTLLTNVPLSTTGRKDVEKLLKEGLPGANINLLGAGDIDGMLDSSDSVRLSFPQILGLRDIFALIGETVNKDIINRSRVALSMGAELAKTFVATAAYEEALEVLVKRNFVVLTGPPEMGKTTIARIIALARLSDGWEAYECRSPADLLRVHDPDKRQVFVADDAFGSTEYQPEKGNEWADELESVLHMLDSRHWLLLTSRPAPLRTALEKLYLQGAAENFPKPQEVIVNASQLSVEEKAQMLYRHAKSGIESEEGRSLIAMHAEAMVAHADFTPLRIRNFVTLRMPDVLEQPEKEREDFMDKAVEASMAEPTASMKTSFAGLDRECRVLLIAMLDSHESTISLKDELAPAFERHLGTAPHRSATAAAGIVNEHFVRLAQWEDPTAEEPSHVEWVHPSVRDMVIGHLMEDTAARRAFLANTGIEGLMLALSSSGGAEGERQFPLLEGEAEWSKVERRVVELLSMGGGDSQDRVLPLLGDTARLSRSVIDRTDAKRLGDLTHRGLEALQERWALQDAAVSNIELRNFYRASADLLNPVQSPDLAKTWNTSVETVSASLPSIIEQVMQAAEEWLDLATLLQRNDPEQLTHLSFPARYEELVEKIVEVLESEEDDLGTPEISDVDDPEQYEEAPPELDWISGLEDVLGPIGDFFPTLKERCETVTSLVFDKAGEWEEYGDRHKAFHEPEPDEDYEGGGRYRGEGEAFSVESVFSDL
jgi:hypothetical protein